MNKGGTSAASVGEVPTTDNLQDSLTLKDVGTPQLPDGGGVTSDTTPLGGVEDEGRRKRVISSARLLELTRKTLNEPLSRLWSYNIRPKAVTLLVGETSAGKTTFLHNLAYHLAKGEEFLGIAPPKPLRVLYLDYESGDEIIAEHLDTIGTAAGWDFLDLTDLPRGKDLTRILSEEIKAGPYDVVIIDSLMEAYPVDDENDNPEAAEQMLTVRKLAHDTGAAIVVVHNAGQKALAKKKRTDAKNLARGATARMDKADIVLNYTINGPKDSDERVLEVVKSRGRNLNDKIVVRFAGELGFQVVTESKVSEGVAKKTEGDVLAILGILSAEGETEPSRGTILLRLGIDQKDKTEAQRVDRALTDLIARGEISRVQKGIYSLAKSAPEAKAAA